MSLECLRDTYMNLSGVAHIAEGKRNLSSYHLENRAPVGKAFSYPFVSPQAGEGLGRQDLLRPLDNAIYQLLYCNHSIDRGYSQ